MSGHRRSLVNYEQLCKTSLADPALALQQPGGPSGEAGSGGSKKKKNYKKTSSTPQQEQDDVTQNTPVLTIRDLYKLPSRKKVPLVIFQTCKKIMNQAVPVSQLNIDYTGHCVPKEKEYRKVLRRKYGAKFGNYYEEQDMIIMRRFESGRERGGGGQGGVLQVTQ